MMFSFSISARMWISFSMSPMATPLRDVSTLFFLMYLGGGIVSTYIIIIIIVIDLLGSILSFSASFNNAMYNGKLTTAKLKHL